MDKLGTNMKRRLAIFLVLLVATLVQLLSPVRVMAHAFPSSEQPLVGSNVISAPAEVSITFDSPIENLFAKLEVADAHGMNEAAGPAQVDSDHRRLSIALKPLKPGVYDVKWSVVAADGHRTEGSYQFTVTGAGR
jgi:methionine-rich copper-binding protein CopC